MRVASHEVDSKLLVVVSDFIRMPLTTAPVSCLEYEVQSSLKVLESTFDNMCPNSYNYRPQTALSRRIMCFSKCRPRLYHLSGISCTGLWGCDTTNDFVLNIIFEKSE